ncbi:hypothetical protein LXL04_004069 [Taraxacum kok-saghyz]
MQSEIEIHKIIGSCQPYLVGEEDSASEPDVARPLVTGGDSEPPVARRRGRVQGMPTVASCDPFHRLLPAIGDGRRRRGCRRFAVGVRSRKKGMPTEMSSPLARVRVKMKAAGCCG